MKNYLFYLFFCAGSVSAQTSLTNITNYCANSSVTTGTTSNSTHFAQVGNLLLFRSPGDCAETAPQGAPSKIWAYDGQNAPYLLKFPDGSDFVNTRDLEYNDILTLNGKVYLSCIALDNTKTGLYVFDPAVSVTHLLKIASEGFPDTCKQFRSLAKYNNGIVYTSFVNSNCYYDPAAHTSTFWFNDFREGNFGYGGHYFSNSELNGHFYFTTINDGHTGMEIKKYNPVTHTSAVIANIPTTVGFYPNGQTVFSNKLYYIHKKDDTGVELFQYDGTTETCLDLNPGTGSSYPNSLTIVNNKLYFTCHYNNKYYLYQYDGNNPPEIVHESNFNLMDYYSGMCELNNELYLIKTYDVPGAGINTDLYKYSESTNTLILLNTFSNFTTAISNWDFTMAFYGPVPQYYENKRGYLINFKNELYILGSKLNAAGTVIGANNDIWKVDHGSLKASEISLNQDHVKYYPNPTKNDLNIDLDKVYQTIEVQITTTEGKMVKKQNFSNTEKIKIQLPKATGVYYVTLIYGTKKSTYKIIKEE
ncbi:MAG: T9SS type A sorting domain-containing protein [Chryseobacterium sp.]|jgi:ELWxxDGT repeat protein|uniref:T9SS type A sorting domain-containing protein n=1 Tax=Chryseobacterium sp. TaxID=1871047 RepID=UPI00282139BD|nr:T9SS type A sorting domain-containing protein [Chryseobacterium sp.]MDR2237003.1 T9SS type A sorting domain-containing protein [Chryseobacterium sp.]